MKKQIKNIEINKFMNIVQNVSTEADMYIAGDIEDMEWWDEDVTPQKILDSLYELGDIANLNVIINSYGGSVVAGDFIINLFDEYRRKTNVVIHTKIANAYSMASGIAMIGDKVSIFGNGTFMVHKPLSSTYGNADDMRKQAEVLDMFESVLIKNYMRHFSGTEKELRDLLEKETWLTAEQALEYGFVDEIIEPLQMSACANGIKVNNTLFTQKGIVDILNKQLQQKVEGGNDMKYSNLLLEQYGITEDAFNAFENVSDMLQVINAKKNAEIEDAREQAVKDAEQKFENSVIIEFEEIKNAFELKDAPEDKAVEDFTSDVLINLAKIGNSADPETQNKLSMYESVLNERNSLKNQFIEDTLEVGVRAMGAENFTKSTWITAFNSMNYETIKSLRDDWDKQAKKSLNAGIQVSENPEDCANPYGSKKETNSIPKKENLNV